MKGASILLFMLDERPVGLEVELGAVVAVVAGEAILFAGERIGRLLFGDPHGQLHFLSVVSRPSLSRRPRVLRRAMTVFAADIFQVRRLFMACVGAW